MKTAAVAAGLLLASASTCLRAQDAAPADADRSAAETADERFDVLEYRVLGNTKLTAATIERAVYPHLGPHRSMRDVEAARTALEDAYRLEGLATVFVDVPEQRIEKGVVRLRVTEGRVDRVRVTGARYFSNREIRAAVPALTRGESPRLPEVQRQLQALNQQTPDRVVQPVLKAGQAPGSVDVELKVADVLPLHGSFELNDRYTADTSRLRVNAAIGYHNLWQQQHIAMLQYQTSPETRENLRVLVGTYMLPLPGLERTSLALYAVDSNTDVATIGTLSVLGNGQIYGARVTRVLPDAAELSHNVSFGVEYKDFLENIRLTEEEGLQTPISYLNWIVGYGALWRPAESMSFAFDSGLNFGLRGVANGEAEFADKRFRGKPGYFALTGGVQYTQDLPWKLRVATRVGAQYAPAPLISNQQFSIGGVDTVRGYLESALLGDYGATYSIELRQTAFSALLGMKPWSAYAFVFYDGGYVAVHDPLPAEIPSHRIGSIGLGVRVDDWHGLGLSLIGAHALDAAGPVSPGDDRVHFSLRYSF